MVSITSMIFAILLLVVLTGCGRSVEPDKPDAAPANENAVARSASRDGQAATPSVQLADFRQIEWTDLMPADDLDALLNPPEYLADIEDGSAEDQISSNLQSAIALASDDRYQQALASTRVVEAMDGQAIRLPGFIVPLEFSDEFTTTQFFLVPFFGACLHMPPPPPNQIIFVDYPAGLKLTSLTEPFWLSGVVRASLIENDVAIAAYTMNLQHYEKYLE